MWWVILTGNHCHFGDLIDPKKTTPWVPRFLCWRRWPSASLVGTFTPVSMDQNGAHCAIYPSQGKSWEQLLVINSWYFHGYPLGNFQVFLGRITMFQPVTYRWAMFALFQLPRGLSKYVEIMGHCGGWWFYGLSTPQGYISGIILYSSVGIPVARQYKKRDEAAGFEHCSYFLLAKSLLIIFNPFFDVNST